MLCSLLYFSLANFFSMGIFAMLVSALHNTCSTITRSSLPRCNDQAPAITLLYPSHLLIRYYSFNCLENWPFN